VISAVSDANWAEILTAVGTLLVAGGVAYAGVQVRDSRRARSAQFASELAWRWDSPRMVQSRKRLGQLASVPDRERVVRTACKDPTSDDYLAFSRFLNFFEQLGAAFADDRHGRQAVAQLFAPTLTGWWEIWGEVIPDAWGTHATAKGHLGALAVQLAQDRARGDRRGSARSFLRWLFITPR
jgi:hypothetical protein